MSTELDGLDPETTVVELSSGTRVTVVRLRARQFFKFLRILTHGALPLVGDSLKLDPDGDPNEFAQRLLSILALSIPDAEDETVLFIRSMVQPVGLHVPARNKQDNEQNEVMWNLVDAELFNPELDDLVSIIEAIVKQEANDIQALGKRLSSLFKLAQKTGQLKSPKQTPQTGNSSEGSAAPSTSSRPSTDGPTTNSGDSRSDDSVNA